MSTSRTGRRSSPLALLIHPCKTSASRLVLKRLKLNMHLAFLTALASTGLTGCALSGHVERMPFATGSKSCAEPEGWSAIAAQAPDFVVFGELHGTQEAPGFLGSLACSLARDRNRILIAIEFSVDDNEALQRAWATDRAKFETLLLEVGSWGRQDGVTSEAMYWMLNDLHRLRTLGYPIEIAAFNGAASPEQRAKYAHLPGQGPHEAILAENIASFARAGNFDHVLILVGNLHAQKKSSMLGGAVVDPMAKRLEHYGKVISLDIKHRGGFAWGCRRSSSQKLECSQLAVGKTNDIKRAPFISLNEGLIAGYAGEDYDGFYWLGPITSSPPIRPPIQ